MKKFLIYVNLVFSPFAYADINHVQIERMTVLSEKVYIKVSSLPASRPACATNGGFHFAMPINDDNGKATLSMILAAYASKSSVSIRSLDTCTYVNNVEDLRYLILE